MNVLILDRSELARVVRAILYSNGHRSLQARTLENAERMLRRETVDAIVLNVQSMGPLCTRWVRTWLWGQRSSPRVVVIAAEELDVDERGLLEVYRATVPEPPITPRLLLDALGETRRGGRPKPRTRSKRLPGSIRPGKPPDKEPTT